MYTKKYTKTYTYKHKMYTHQTHTQIQTHLLCHAPSYGTEQTKQNKHTAEDRSVGLKVLRDNAQLGQLLADLARVTTGKVDLHMGQRRDG